jgi:hypothetical protein
MTEHPSNPGVFAAAIARRYGGLPRMAPLVDMMVRLNPRFPAESISSFETCVQIAPAVTVNNPPAAACWGLEPAGPHFPPALPPIVRRLAHRQRRLEPDAGPRPAHPQPARTPPAGSVEIPAAPPAAAAAAPPPAAAAAARAPRPLPMVVSRRAAATPGGTAGTERRNGGSPQTFERRASSNRTPADERRSGKAPAGIDLEQLTEKVVRAIDRRIVAYRERTARS